ncbi:hypothetical protein K493DRAFT_212900 [Basidiobolus meristosporus CBS 931.73]|uniref:Cystinosin n=1 Tax=Basidiobolus meristosporus CBS 931.73 TaxID=1314790 RepID=A0A1Y1YNB3_9FUNG|nr:hypothetical protein K493DRAFT_212900 [Basidiobolus meristosporus CBS 931.73]|eukprot:ORX99256.1 hypothetical protein K493DRAFT_212900 [Basidiobolus meristosporus CBS 931.73]
MDYATISAIIGWTYFLAWSASFYPQVLLRKASPCVQGLSTDFVVYNIYGFTCYSLYNSAFYWSSEIRKEYRDRNDGHDNLVQVNDVFFGLHALLVSLVTLGQILYYKQQPSKLLKLFTAVTLVIASGILLCITSGWGMWIDLLYFLSYVKLTISIIKYCPQVYLNWKSKSTVGWSIHNIILDFTGGILSIAQLLLDAAVANDWSGITGNPIKLGLGWVSILFDLVFFTQHYILYPDRTDPIRETVADEERPILTNSEHS